MLTIYLYLIISFILCYYLGESAPQPYFPPQITFTVDNDLMIYAIDEINQRAYKKLSYSSTQQDTSYVSQHFPFSNPDSPRSKYYVQLLL
jgi:hypothetical protein